VNGSRGLVIGGSAGPVVGVVVVALSHVDLPLDREVTGSVHAVDVRCRLGLGHGDPPVVDRHVHVRTEHAICRKDTSTRRRVERPRAVVVLSSRRCAHVSSVSETSVVC
jgi:hypothetical protein